MVKSSLNEAQKRINALSGQRYLLKKNRDEREKASEEIKEYIGLSDEIADTLETLTDNLLGHLAKVIEEQLTMALQEVLEQPVKLKTERDIKRGRMNLSFSIDRDGKTEDIMKGQGGSVANILSVGLRLFALTTLGAEQHRRFLVLDEQDCWLRPDLVPRFVKIVHDAGRALGYQILMISHHHEGTFTNYADRIFRLTPSSDGIAVEVSEPDATVQDTKLM